MEERRGCRRPRSGRAQGCGASSVVCGAVCGRIGRERGHSGPAFDRAGSRVLAGGSAVGGFGLRVVLCGLLAPDGEGGGSVGQEEDLRCGTGPLHGGFTLLRPLCLPGDAGGLARIPGARGCDHRTGGALERDRAVAAWTAVAAGGGAAGLLLGGFITDVLGWEWIFFVNLPVGASGIALSHVLLPESRDPSAPRRLDILGAGTVTSGLVLLVLGLTRTEEAGFGSPITLATLGFAAALFGAFVFVERRAADPLVPLRLFRLRRLVGAALVASTASGTSAVEEGKRGLASGFMNTSAQVGTALGLAALLTLAATRTVALSDGAESAAEALVAGYRL